MWKKQQQKQKSNRDKQKHKQNNNRDKQKHKQNNNRDKHKQKQKNNNISRKTIETNININRKTIETGRNLSLKEGRPMDGLKADLLRPLKVFDYLLVIVGCWRPSSAASIDSCWQQFQLEMSNERLKTFHHQNSSDKC
jgi:ATP-dependent 26S proteasome regulatory subunit